MPLRELRRWPQCMILLRCERQQQHPAVLPLLLPLLLMFLRRPARQRNGGGVCPSPVLSAAR